MWRTGLVMLFSAFLSLVGVGVSADPAAQAFVEGIYKSYGGPNSPGVKLNGKAALERYFTPALAALIEGDAKRAKAKGEVPALDGDPFVDAQDWDIKKVSILVAETGPNKAVATVTFSNYGEDREVKLDLVKTATDWRIDDIHWREGSLRGLYRPR
jgi:hypothetical protein